MKIQGLYENYPRRYGKAKTIVYNKNEFIRLVNRDNGHTDVFISVYSYSRLKEIDNIYKIDSSSAIIDKIFLDIDIKDWVDYDKSEILKFKEKIKSITKDMKLNRKQKKVISELIKEGKITGEKSKKTLKGIYLLYKKPEAESKLYVNIIKLEEYLRNLDLLRIWVFSGGGFHLYLYVNNDPFNKKVFNRNCADFLSDLVCDKDGTYYDEKIKLRKRRLWDPHSPPKLSQMARVIGTYNPRRKLYCISLTEEDLDKGFEHIKQMAKHPLININYLGKNIIKFSSSFDSNEILESCSLTFELEKYDYPDNIKDLLYSFGMLFNEIPLCIKRFMKPNQPLDYHERYILITYLYRCGLSKNEIIEVLKIILTSDRLYHCCGVIKNGYTPTGMEKSRIETQIEDIIENDYYLSCSQIKNYGLCVATCLLKDVLYYVS